jgi:hypothetical protein
MQEEISSLKERLNQAEILHEAAKSDLVAQKLNFEDRQNFFKLIFGNFQDDTQVTFLNINIKTFLGLI